MEGGHQLPQWQPWRWQPPGAAESHTFRTVFVPMSSETYKTGKSTRQGVVRVPAQTQPQCCHEPQKQPPLSSPSQLLLVQEEILLSSLLQLQLAQLAVAFRSAFRMTAPPRCRQPRRCQQVWSQGCKGQ